MRRNTKKSLVSFVSKMLKSKYVIVLGDLLVIAIITIIGFASHREVGAGTANPSVLPRMAAVFFPLAIGWFFLAPALGLFQPEVTTNPRQLWRPALGALFVGPLAAIVRGFLLNAPVIPIFAAVLATTSALGMLIWRTMYFLFARKVS